MDHPPEPIAIIGVGCRFPGSGNDPEQFWSNLCAGFDGVQVIPKDRWDAMAHWNKDPDVSGKMVTMRGGFVDDIDMFDAEFFGIAPAEAAHIDPQQRLLLETSWQAIEDAGITLDQLAGSDTGVYVGVSGWDWWELHHSVSERENIHANTNTGGALSICANRLSYVFDLHGPSMAVDTACSSSLTAIHLAVRALRAGECSAALTGGAYAILKPEANMAFSRGGFLSPDGVCASFDAAANGFVPSEGAGVLMLKTLSEAERCGDMVHALIIGSAINEDGRSRGLTVPSEAAQTAMLRAAYRDAAVAPSVVSYVEAHGTGTPVGDPIEARSIASVLAGPVRSSNLLIGSVKSNMGHLEAASGVAGVIKVVLALKHRRLPPNIHINNPSPKIDWQALNLRVVSGQSPLPWHADRLVAGVNSFGFGGSNAHIVLEAPRHSSYLASQQAQRAHAVLSVQVPDTALVDAFQQHARIMSEEAHGPDNAVTDKDTGSDAEDDAATPAVLSSSHQVFGVAAKTRAALCDLAKAYIKWIDANADQSSLADLCAAVALRRTPHRYRLAIVAASFTELRAALALAADPAAELDASCTLVARAAASPVSVAMIFSGQGPQWFAMGKDLMQSDAVFAAEMERVDVEFTAVAGWSIIGELSRSEDDSRINHTAIAQPAIMAVQIALARCWQALGVSASAVVGHSVGEVAAAYIAGAISLHAACVIIYHRSRIQDRATGTGTMMAAAVSKAEAQALLRQCDSDGRCSIAAVNAPRMLTFAGPRAALDRVAAVLEADATFHRFLAVNVPFHSPAMETLHAALVDALADDVTLGGPASIPLYSTVTAQREPGTHLTPEYWYRNVRQSVLYTDALASMVADGVADAFIEVSPHPILIPGAKAALNKANDADALVLPSIRRKKPELPVLLLSRATLWVRGAVASLPYSAAPTLPAPLPLYPMQRERHWAELPSTRRLRIGDATGHPHIKRVLRSARDPLSAVVQVDLNPRHWNYIAQHLVQDEIVFPGAGHCDLAITAASMLHADATMPCMLADVAFQRALFVPDQAAAADGHAVHLDLAGHDGSFLLATRNTSDHPWLTCSSGTVYPPSAPALALLPVPPAAAQCTQPVHLAGLRADLAACGVHLGPAFQSITDILTDAQASVAVASLSVPEDVRTHASRFTVHPAVLDCCFQTLFGLVHARFAQESCEMGGFLPVQIAALCIHDTNALADAATLRVVSVLSGFAHDRVQGTSWLCDADTGRVLVTMRDFVCSYLAGTRSSAGNAAADIASMPVAEAVARISDCFYTSEWQLRERVEHISLRRPEHYIKPPSSIKEEMEQMIVDDITSQPSHDEYLRHVEPAMNRMGARYVIAALYELSVDMSCGAVFTTRDVVAAIGIEKQHLQMLLHRMLDIASIYGVLQRTSASKHEDQAAWRVVQPDAVGELSAVCQDALAAEMAAIIAKHASFAQELVLLQRCGPFLARVLLDQVDSVQLIFPEDDWDGIVKFYQTGHSFLKYNRLARHAVAQLLQNLPAHQTLRVLEIGAGTGGMTQAVLPSLPADRTRYTFSDVSRMFGDKARDRFASEYPFVEYTVLNIEQDPMSQGFQPDSYDIIIASDVLHATCDMSRTMRHVAQLLAPNGLLVMLEVTTPPMYMDLIFGMLSGWWLFDDRDVRPDHCCLPQAAWHPLLASLGFHDVVALCDAASPDQTTQTLFLMRNSPVPDFLPAPAAASNSDAVCLILADASERVARLVAAAATESGITSHVIPAGTSCDALAIALQQAHSHVSCVIACTPCDLSNDSDADDDADVLAVTQVVKTLACALDKRLDSPRLALVFAGAQTSDADDVPPVLKQAAIWGLGRVLIQEQPRLRPTLVDIGAAATATEAAAMLAELTACPAAGEGQPAAWEREILLRGAARRAVRIIRAPGPSAPLRAVASQPGIGGRYAAGMTSRGVLSNLRLHAVHHAPALAADDVEIAVHAAALNFHDVMTAMDMLSDDAVAGGLFGHRLGFECAGDVIAVGADVTDIAVGSRVCAIAPDALAGRVVTKASHCFTLSPETPYDQAAAAPVVYLTAYYALHTLARISSGQCILVHSAAGGVGIAAINLARAAGCTVIATAGSECKRTWLRDAMGLTQVLDSRAPDTWYAAVMQATAGHGVDVVINCLSGRAIAESVRVTAAFGTFIELGKRDIYNDGVLSLRPFGNNLTYCAVDVDRLLAQRPAMARRLLLDALATARAEPAVAHPLTRFPIDQVDQAMAYLASGAHIGKVIVEMSAGSVNVLPALTPGILPHRSYLITGGTSGVGLRVAAWLAEQGATHLVLVSRSGTCKTDAEAQVMAKLQQSVSVHIARIDCTDRAAISALLRDIRAGAAPIAGVVHAAMVLQDQYVAEMTPEAMQTALRPKMRGAWILHTESLCDDVQMFVLFSSMMVVFGNPCQGNYAAGNAYIDALAALRRHHGLPASSINWGAIGDAGWVSRQKNVQAILELQGVDAFALPEALAAFCTTLRHAPRQWTAARTRWEFARSSSDPRFIDMVLEADRLAAAAGASLRGSGDGSAGSAVDLLTELTSLPADAAAERHALLATSLKATVARILGMQAARLDDDTSLTAVGLDSLMANQVRNWIESTLGQDFPVMKLMRGPTINELTTLLVQALPSECRSASDDDARSNNGSSAGSSSDGDGSDVSTQALSPGKVQPSSAASSPSGRRAMRITDAHRKALEADGVVDFPLSSAQQRMLFLSQLQPDNAMYNETWGTLRLRGSVDSARLHRALNTILRRHTILRTVLEVDARGHASQTVLPASDMMPNMLRSNATCLADAKQQVVALARRPFNLSREMPMRFALISLAPDDVILAVVSHHVAVDGWSGVLWFRELQQHYNADVDTVAAAAAASDVLQYIDYTLCEHKQLANSYTADAHLDWWSTRLADVTLVSLPLDHPRPAEAKHVGAVVAFDLPAALVQDVHAAARLACTSSFTLILMSWQLMLARLAGATDVTVGAPVANRNSTETEGILGHVVNTLVHRQTFPADLAESVGTAVQRAHAAITAALERQHVPFERVVEAVQPDRSLAQAPLFSTMLVLLNMPLTPPDLADLSVERVPVHTGYSKFDMTLELLPRPDGSMAGQLEYDSVLFDRRTADLVSKRFLHILQQISAARDTQLLLQDIQVMSPSEQTLVQDTLPVAEVIVGSSSSSGGGGGEDVDDEGVLALHELVARQVEASPDAVALIHHSLRMTYAQLWHRVAQVHAALLQHGVKPGDRVALAVPRSADMLACMLAALATGAAFVPLDVSYPLQRLQMMLDLADAAVLIARRDAEPAIPMHPLILWVNDVSGECDHMPTSPPPVLAMPKCDVARDPAYLIFTSGSSGTPKAVEMPHRSLSRLVTWQAAQDGAVTTAQFTPLSFDVATQEIFATLITGAALVMVDEQQRRDPERLLAFLAQHKIQRLFLPFIALQSLASVAADASVPLPSLRHVITAGEQLRVSDALTKWFRSMPDARLCNQYGPSETHVVTAYQMPVQPDAWLLLPPIGRPLPHAAVYVLLPGTAMLAPIGVPGEIVVAGDALATGYHARADLTDAAFATLVLGGAALRVYRTGDRAVWRSDGQLCFLGRIAGDTQVKIRGMRVELGDIEAALRSHVPVRDAAVSYSDGRLAATVVVLDGAQCAADALHTWLTEHLPDHMIPVLIQVADQLPTTPSGKLDRRALAAQIPWTGLAAATRAATPSLLADPAALVVAAIWQDVLACDGADEAGSNFFALGGHSLLATQLVMRVRAALHVALPLKAVFQHATLAAFTRHVLAVRAAADEPALSPAPLQPHALLPGMRVPVSPSQLNILAFDQLAHTDDRGVYHIPLAIKTDQALDLPALQHAVALLAARHPQLVMPVTAAGAVMPVDADAVAQRILRVDTDVSERFPGDIDAWRAAVIAEPLEPSRGDLLRIAVAAEHDVLQIVLHHVVGDAASLRVLVRDLATFYTHGDDLDAAALPPLPVSFYDHARWALDQQQSVAAPSSHALRHWCTQLAGVPAVLPIQTDAPRPQTSLAAGTKRYPGASISFHLSAEVASSLRVLSRRHGVTMFMTLASAWSSVLSRLADAETVVLGVPVAGRSSHAVLQEMIGVFVDMLPIALAPLQAADIPDMLAATRTAFLTAHDAPPVPLSQLAAVLGHAEFTAASPVFQHAFSLQTESLSGGDVTPLGASMPPVPQTRALYDTTLVMQERSNGTIEALLEYSSDLWHASTMDLWLSLLQTTLTSMATVLPSTSPRALPIGDAAQHAGLAMRPSPRADTTLLAQVDAVPADATALDDAAGRVLSYHQMRQCAADLAQLLCTGSRAAGAVGVMLERGAALPIAMLAVWRAGGVYVPIDLALPAARRDAMLAASCASTLLVSQPGAAPASFPGRVITLDAAGCVGDVTAPPVPFPTAADDDDADDDADDDGDAVDVEYVPCRDAAVIFTSGSTGTPKGVLLSHAALQNLVAAHVPLFRVDASSRILQWSSASFDTSLLEVMLALCSGATLLVPRAEAVLPGLALAMTLASLRISHLITTPSAVAALPDATQASLPHLTLLNVGGEAMPRTVLQTWLSPTRRVINCYGPSEATVDATAVEYVHDAASDPATIPVTIGRPIPGAHAWILDPVTLLPLPACVPGELCLSGANLAVGYLDAGETDAAFTTLVLGGAARRVYRTGDRAVWRSDGQLYFLGRIAGDTQVKIRGMRVELGDIEAALRSHVSVRDAAVIKHAEHGLVAFVVAREPGDNPSGDQLRQHLRQLLPLHMVPGGYLLVPQLPTTSSGKLDRRALVVPSRQPPAHHEPVSSPEHDAAVTSTLTPAEHRLALAWAQVLDLRTLPRVDDDFFALGGHSLLAARLLGLMEQTATLRDLFRFPQLHSMALLLRDQVDGDGDDPLASWSLVLPGDDEEDVTLDGAALACVPDDVLARIGASGEGFVTRLMQDNKPVLLQTLATAFGCVGVILLPLSSAQVYANSAATAAACLAGSRFAARLGARRVSLTGLLASATRGGAAVLDLAPPTAITTGHAATVAAVVLNATSLLRRFDRQLGKETLAIVGCGSIGVGALLLLMQHAGTPRAVVLVDVPGRAADLHMLASSLPASVPVSVVTTEHAAEMYAASLIIGAASAGDLIDVSQLRPGTLLIDDSAPHIVSGDLLHQRWCQARDIHFTEGGDVALPSSVASRMHVRVSTGCRQDDSVLHDALLGPSQRIIMACALSCVLDDLSDTRGSAADAQDDCAHALELMQRAGITASADSVLHFDHVVIDL